MKTRILMTLIISGCLVASSGFAGTQTSSWQSSESPQTVNQPDDPPAYVPGEVLVKYDSKARMAASVDYYAENYNMSELKRFEAAGVQQVKLPKDMDVDEALDIYQRDPDVAYAEPNYYRSYTSTKPDDDFFSRQWALDNTGQSVQDTTGKPGADIGAVEAWEISTGNKDVVVAVIDSGIDYHHPDLSDNIWKNEGEIPDNGIDDDGNGYVDDVHGWNFGEQNNDPVDPYGHGTTVASTIAARGNNAMGISGVAWSAQVMPLRTGGANGLTTSAIIEAVEYAEAMGADVINMSFGGEGRSQAEKDAIDSTSALVVCAAGNSGNDNDVTATYPGNYDCSNIISVAATNQNDQLAYFSNFGKNSVDVGAPGVNIYGAKANQGRSTLWYEDFEGKDISDWHSRGENNTWALTSAETHSGDYSLTDSPDGDYKNNTDTTIMAPPIDLSSQEGAELEFRLRGISEGSTNGLIDVLTPFATLDTENIASNWQMVQVSGSTQKEWVPMRVDLSKFDGQEAVHIGFQFKTDNSVVFDGWYIDDVAITVDSPAYSGGPDDYKYDRGTSFAAPVVAGIAALIKSVHPELSSAEIKAKIKSSVDELPDLKDKLATGGRVNAAKSLAGFSDGDSDATSVEDEDSEGGGGGGGGGCFIGTVFTGGNR
ncbi:MAG: S8 family serine peptidase [Thermodesulfobacteriota bacterium]